MSNYKVIEGVEVGVEVGVELLVLTYLIECQ